MELAFRRSSRCEALNQPGCVEVAAGPGFIVVRDSTAPHGPKLTLTLDAWRDLIRQTTRDRH